jgi:hypothetical protein
MKKISYASAVMLLSVAAFAPALRAQPAPGAAGTPADRCAALRAAMAKHPAPNAAAEERWRKRLAECEAGQKSSSGKPQSDQPGKGGQGAKPGQPASTGAPRVSVAPASSAVGRPVSRGTPSRMAIAPSAQIANAMPIFSSLRFTVVTADDDLRSDSRAWINVRPPNGASQQCLLKEGDTSFENNSSNRKTCNLNVPLTADQLRTTRFVLEYDGGPGAIITSGEDVVASASHSYDNWKVREISIAAMREGQGAQCVVDAKGRPLLVELKQDVRRFDLRGGC